MTTAAGRLRSAAVVVLVLPHALAPEGNGYRVDLTYAPSGEPVAALAVPGTLSVRAPAAPTGVLRLIEGRWARLAYTEVSVEAGFSSVVQLDGPITLMQLYDPATPPPPTTAALTTAPPSPAAPVDAAPAVGASTPWPVVPLVVVGLLVAASVGGLLAARRRRGGARP